MKKLIIAAGALVLASAPAFADGAFDGFYAGVDGLYSNTKIDGEKDGSFSGRVNAGYGKTYSKIYLGGEGNLDFSGFDMSVGGEKIKKDLGYGATGRLGYEFSPRYLGYGLVGYERADIEVGGSKETFNGIRFGAGVETKVQDNISVRTEVSQSRLKNDDVTIKDLKSTVGLAIRF
ncbi:porin family protein [Mesorhizobium sp. SP-1A]|uniref:porin family protein n=1 Tax=Mesorhizobium sp. SP-1A TaxID=3077840 RepID=UPI0028F7373B|nr:porin family protein [Mesorhizobium sp. SP-1A]